MARDSRVAFRFSFLLFRGLWLATALTLMLAGVASAHLSESGRLAAVYDLILNAQFERASEQLAEACPPAPVPACQALGVVALWWQIQINPDNRRDDRRFTERAAAAVAAADAWTRREPGRAEAWFYLAGSYAPLVEWEVLRGERLAAARNATKVRNALEHALQLDPTLVDAHFGIGLYDYYADVASTAAKILRWLLLLPGGDRARGLQEMLQAGQGGELVRGEVDYQLHLIYVWYEHQPVRAIDLLKLLDGRYPFNPLFLQRIAEIEDTSLHDARASAASWRALLDRAKRGAVYDAARVATEAQIKLRTLAAQSAKK